MKNLAATFITAASLFVASQAVVVRLWTERDCTGAAASRNVFDNTCAATGGFQSYQITAFGGDTQQLTVFSQNACAGEQTSQVCADGSGTPLNQCVNASGGSNALQSYANIDAC